MSSSYYRIIYNYKENNQDKIGEIIINCKDGKNIISSIEKSLIEKYADVISFKSISLITCQGCIYDSPGQLRHMDIGGCLYVPFDQ